MSAVITKDHSVGRKSLIRDKLPGYLTKSETCDSVGGRGFEMLVYSVGVRELVIQNQVYLAPVS